MTVIAAVRQRQIAERLVIQSHVLTCQGKVTMVHKANIGKGFIADAGLTPGGIEEGPDPVRTGRNPGMTSVFRSSCHQNCRDAHFLQQELKGLGIAVADALTAQKNRQHILPVFRVHGIIRVFHHPVVGIAQLLVIRSCRCCRQYLRQLFGKPGICFFLFRL